MSPHVTYVVQFADAGRVHYRYWCESCNDYPHDVPVLYHSRETVERQADVHTQQHATGQEIPAMSYADPIYALLPNDGSFVTFTELLDNVRNGAGREFYGEAPPPDAIHVHAALQSLRYNKRATYEHGKGWRRSDSELAREAFAFIDEHFVLIEV